MSNGGARVHSRFIPFEEIDHSAVVQWRFGAVGSHGEQVLHGLPAPLAQQPDTAELAQAELLDMPQTVPDEDWQNQLDQAREQGRQEGLEQGRTEASGQWQQRMDDYVNDAGEQSAQRMQALLSAMDASLKQLQANTAEQLLELACDIARQVVRQELRTQPQALLPVVREALDLLVDEGRAATVRLNPADYASLESALGQEQGAQAKVQWLSDASIAQGDVRVDAGGSHINAGLEQRWRRAVAALGLVSTWYDGGADAP